MRRLVPVLFAFILAVAAGCSSAKRPVVTLKDLAAYDSMSVTLEGDPALSYLTGDSSYYSEWAYGYAASDGSASLTPGYQSNAPLKVITPYGEVTLDVFTIRAFLGPSFSRSYDRGSLSIAPAPIQRLLEQRDGTIAIREYVIKPGRTYYARVHTETFYQPAADGTPQELVQHVLEISDLPFKNGKPQREATPSYAGYGTR